MCGIAAILKTECNPGGRDELRAMRSLVGHRGPDGTGEVFLADEREGRLGPRTGNEESWRVGLGHTRLAIIDLSNAATQPMTDGEGRWIVYNGEVYNAPELRAELMRAGRRFRSESDTEVVLAAYAAWGVESLARLRGMWAFVIVDGRRGTALLARDRLGIKPLYLTRHRSAWVAVSEPKQLSALAGWRANVNEPVLRRYLATGYEDPNETFFGGVFPLEPGCTRELDLHSGELGRPQPYWHPERVEVSVYDPAEAARRLRAALEESTLLHLRSDVDVGSALSGGLDSSAVTGLVATSPARGEVGQHTFSVVFPGHALDEGRFARAVVKRHGLVGHTVTPTAEAFLADLDAFVYAHDEPVGSLSQYAGYAVARLTRQAGLKVSLNGQGGDEILAGYWQSYAMHLRDLARTGRLVTLARELGATLLPGGNREVWPELAAMARRYHARRRATRELAEGEGTAAPSPRDLLQATLALSPRARRLADIRTLYLPRLLRWDDRNFMAHGVEGRYPFLDHVVIETALSFDSSVLYHRGFLKAPLREAACHVLPAEITGRRDKVGFETPQRDWLRGPLASALDRFLRTDDAVFGYAARDGLRQRFERLRAGRSSIEDEQALFRAFAASRWLARFVAPSGGHAGA